MSQPEETHQQVQSEKQEARASRPGLSKHVSDHLANERTFLAWLRTGLAVMGFGFVVARFGLLLRELGLKLPGSTGQAVPVSTIIGILLTLLGIFLLVVALFNFLHYRRAIDKEQFSPHAGYVIVLTIVTGVIGVILAIYLYLT